MIVFGGTNCIPNNIKGDYVIYNLLSLNPNCGVYDTIDILPSARDFNYTDNKDYDIRYLNFIFGDDYYFYEFFSKIIYNAYIGKNVFIIVDRNEVYDNTVESLIKMIQQRYGYNSGFINDPDDIEYLNKDESFSIEGLQNLDIDKERFSYLYTCRNMYMDSDGIPRIRGYEGYEYL